MTVASARAGEESVGRRRPVLRSHTWAWSLLVVALAASVATPFVSAGVFGGDLTWPALATSFSSTFLAFVVALAWDRRLRHAADQREAVAEARRAEARRTAEIERRRLEAKRRFAAVHLELERIARSLQRTVDEGRRYKYFFPDLPTGSWAASSAQLSLIVADYALVADLATFYGQIEEMRWRLRFRATENVDEEAFAPLVIALARELLAAVGDLSAAVARQVEEPEVEPVLAPTDSRLVGRRQLTETIRVVDLPPPPVPATTQPG